MISSDYRMKFGKHKGIRLDDVPASYLLWCAENLENLDSEIEDYILLNRQGLEKDAKSDRRD